MINPQTVDFVHSPKLESLWPLGTTPVTVPQTASLLEVITYLGDDSLQEHSCVLVMQGHQLVGLVTERDAIRLLANGIALAAPIGHHMTELLTVLPSDASLKPLDVLALMRQRQIHHLPLIDADKHPVRLITASSLQQALQPPHVLKLQRAQSRMTSNLVTIHKKACKLKHLHANHHMSPR